MFFKTLRLSWTEGGKTNTEILGATDVTRQLIKPLGKGNWRSILASYVERRNYTYVTVECGGMGGY